MPFSAIRSVMVTDWNGKSLSCTFGSSVEVNPKIPQAEYLKEFHATGSNNGVDLQNLSSNQPHRPQHEQQTYHCLAQIHQDFNEEGQQTTVKYYNLSAYLTDLKADKIMYRACTGKENG